MSGPPEGAVDPLHAFISRSLRTEVSDVSEVIIREQPDVEASGSFEGGVRRKKIVAAQACQEQHRARSAE